MRQLEGDWLPTRPTVRHWTHTGVEADLGALADQLQRCSGREPPLQRCVYGAADLLVLAQRHLVTVVVAVAVVSTAVLTAF